MSNSTEPAGINFLDFLFTLSMGNGIKELLLDGWSKEGRCPTSDESFNIGVFVLGFLTLTLSWFGYHAALAQRPHKYESGKDMIRFVLDVLLVIIYGLMMLQYKSINMVLFLLVVVFLIYVVWDIIKILKYKDEFRQKQGTKLTLYRREWVSFFWFLYTLFVYILQLSGLSNRSWILGLAMFGIVFYRVNKIFPLWERLFGVSHGYEMEKSLKIRHLKW